MKRIKNKILFRKFSQSEAGKEIKIFYKSFFARHHNNRLKSKKFEWKDVWKK